MSSPTLSRRNFLAASGAMALTPSLTFAEPLRSKAKSCIFINMVGGPSQLDTFDPKPLAKVDDRGPFRPIRTRVPGMMISELFPKLARMSDKFTLLRGMHHDGPPVHEAGLQLLNTGRLFRDGPEWPCMGAVTSYLWGDREGDATIPRNYMMGHGQIDTGLDVPKGLGAGFLPVPYWQGGIGTSDRIHDVLRSHCEGDPAFDYSHYGQTVFGWNCANVIDPRNEYYRPPGRFITINQFDTVFDRPSWDCHADRGSLRTTLADIRDTVAPSFDLAVAALLTDLESRGLLESTLVVATGEFGRTPWFNSNGGRDHWANAWTALIAGGGTKGGRVIGSTDRTGGEVIDRPTLPQELVASIYHALGIPANATIPGPDGTPVAVYPGVPIQELF